MSAPARLRSAVQPPSALSDESIAHACALGDPQAVGELFDRFHQPIARFLGRLLGSSDEAEDVLQMTFLELARGAAIYKGRSSVRSWLFGIAANLARQQLRAAARRARLRTAAAWLTLSAVDGEGRASARADLSNLKRRLEFLSVKQRLAFVLCEIEGFSAKEAAVILSTTESAIWRRVSDARRRIREELGEDA